MENAKQNKMGTAPIFPLIVSMSLPAMFSMLVNALYNVVDSMFVSYISEGALTAVSLAYPMQNLMIAVATGTGVGVNALLSRNLGEKNFEMANRAAGNAIFLGVVSFAVFALVGAVGSRLYFTVQVDDPEIIAYGVDYLSVIMVLSVGCFGQVLLSRLLQSTGKTFYSMVIQLVGAGLNIVLDPIMIFGLLGTPQMGVAGAAAATVIGQIGGMTLGLVLNQAKNVELRLHLKGFRPNKTILKGILDVGFPSIIMQSISSFMNVFMNLILIAYGNTAVSVLGVYFKLQSFVFMPVFGLGNGLVAIVGYNYGAHLRERVYAAVRVALRMAIVIMAVGMLLFMTIPQVLLSLFEAEGAGDLTAVGCPALRVISLSFILAAVGITLGTVFQAVGKGVYSLINSLCRQLMVLLPAAWLLSRLGDLSAVWWSFPIAEVVSLAVCLLLYRRVDRTMLKAL